MSDEKNTTLHIRPSADVLDLLDAAERRVGGALTRNRLVSIALARGLRDIARDPAVIFETADATSTKPPTPPAEEKASPSVASTPTSSPRKPTAGRWETVSASDLRRLAKDLAALSTEEFNRIRDGAANVKRAAVYDARNGKAGRQVYDALRAYLDRGAKP